MPSGKKQKKKREVMAVEAAYTELVREKGYRQGTGGLWSIYGVPWLTVLVLSPHGGEKKMVDMK